MATANHKLAIVIPTIGRYDDLRRMLQSVAAQTRLPEQVLIVGEGEGNTQVASEFPQLNARFINMPGSSICDARNGGVKEARPDIDLIGFFDDDIVLEPQTFEALLNFWDAAPEDLGAVGCNLVNYTPGNAGRLKSLRLTSRLGLYDTAKGAVMPSGFQTLTLGIQSDTWVRWLPSWAVIYSRKVLSEFGWDPWFESYSYLEDLDLSYRVSKKYRLAMVADARFYHYPSNIGRPNWYLFGKKEVLNRLYFVSKHPELSRPLCCLALSIRAAMSFSLGVAHGDFGYFKRIAGNLAGLLMASRSGLRPVAR